MSHRRADAVGELDDLGPADRDDREQPGGPDHDD
jgi:hypothetical protein